MITKPCRFCGSVLPLSEFYPKPDNADRHSNVCRKCDSKRSVAYRKKRKDENRQTEADLRTYEKNQQYIKRYNSGIRHAKLEFLTEFKLKNGCADCGYRKSAEALDFDHLPGTTKRFCVSQVNGRSWKQIMSEIAKCEVVCANCHRIRTAQRRKQKREC